VKKIMVVAIIMFLTTTLLVSKETTEPNTYLGSSWIKQEKKSIPKAMMYSIMVPGWGDIYAGNKGTGKLLLGAEIAIWFAYFGFQYYGNIQKKDYMQYAHSNANSNLARKNEEYYDAVEVYRTSDDYNTYIREEARDLYPDNPELQNKYFEENGYFGENEWQWNANESFMKYRHLRVTARETFQKAVFMTGFAILNRFCAAVTSSRNVNKHNKRIEEMRWGIEFQLNKVSLVYRF